MPDPFGFIILRHVNSPRTNQYWVTSYECIRRCYPEIPIIILDDNSNPAFVTLPPFELHNCRIVSTTYPGRGELLPFLYFLRDHYFDKVCIIHDSVFWQKTIPFDKSVQFLYHFESCVEMIHVDPNMLPNLIGVLKNHEILLDIYSRKEFRGCFGGMCVITWDCVRQLEDRYEWSRLIDHIHTRKHREALERIWSIMLHAEKYVTAHDESICGDILPLYGSQNYESYRAKRFDSNQIAVKVWTGR